MVEEAEEVVATDMVIKVVHAAEEEAVTILEQAAHPRKDYVPPWVAMCSIMGRRTLPTR